MSEYLVLGSLGCTYDLKEALRQNPTIIRAGDDICAVSLCRIEELEVELKYWIEDSADAWDKCAENKAKLAKAVEWQPIETAPRDGSTITQRVLVFCPPYGAGSANWTGERWNCHFCLNREAQPTHWMPLPDEPATQKGQDNE